MKIIDNVPYEKRLQAVDAAYTYLNKKVLIQKTNSKTNTFLCIAIGLVAGMIFSLLYFFYFEIIPPH